MNNTNNDTLHIDRISYAYDNHHVIRDISFTAEAGKLICLVGPSGCGKSTLLRIIAGLASPDSGSVRIGNTYLNYPDGRSLRPQDRKVGLVFQHPSLFPHMNVADNIAFGLKHLSKAAAAERVRDMLKLIGLEGLEQRYPHMLSGGQHQRVALARSLAPQPRVMLLDEPFANLDHCLRRDLREEVVDVLKKAGVPSIMVTHDPEEALIMADVMVLLSDKGFVRQVGSPETLHNHPSDLESAAFFGVINVIDAKREGDDIISEVGKISADEYAPDLPDGAEAVIVTRPEGLRIHCDQHDTPCINAVVTRARHTGAGWLVAARLDTGTHVRFHHIYGECPEQGERICIQTVPPHLFIFPKKVTKTHGSR